MTYQEETDNNTNFDSENEYDQTLLEQSIEEQKFALIEKIDELYDEIITKFKDGKMYVSDSKICANLTKNKFFYWIISNNPNLMKIFG